MEQLDAFQHEVLEFMDASGGRCIYADPVGARKTGTTLTWLSQQTDLSRTLVVAPKAVHAHWGREARRFFPEARVWGGGTKAQRHIAIYGIASLTDVPGIYVTTYESMKADDLRLLAAKFHTVVFDEGHRLKGRRTDVALCANKLTAKAECILIITGTPILNHADETWQYLHMLNRQAYPSFTRWTDEHFVIETAYYQGRHHRPTRVIHDLKPGHELKLRAQLSKVMIQRQIHELFPDEVWVREPEHVVIDVPMEPAERKAYDKLVKFGWTAIGNEFITTDNKVALTTRLRQLASDWGTLDPSAEDGSKVAAAAELIGDLARRETVVAFAAYKATVHRLVGRLQKRGLRARAYDGDMNGDEREAVLSDYAKGNVDVVVGTLAALGEGVDGLQRRGSSVVFLDHDWTPARNEQAIGRRRRSGQTEQVSVYHLMAPGTIDVVVVLACLNKTNVIEELADRPLIESIYGKGFDL